MRKSWVFCQLIFPKTSRWEEKLHGERVDQFRFSFFKSRQMDLGRFENTVKIYFETFRIYLKIESYLKSLCVPILLLATRPQKDVSLTSNVRLRVNLSNCKCFIKNWNLLWREKKQRTMKRSLRNATRKGGSSKLYCIYLCMLQPIRKVWLRQTEQNLPYITLLIFLV